MYLFFAGCLRHAAAPEGSAQADVRLLNSRGPELFWIFLSPPLLSKSILATRYTNNRGPAKFSPFFLIKRTEKKEKI
jgi:hypothetical protein